MKLFEIVQHEVTANRITVTIAKEDREKEINVPKHKFESWLERTARLAIPMQFHDDEESAELAFSAMTYPEYYEHGNVHKDLYEYILLNQGEKIFDEALKSLQSICEEYKN